MATQTMRGAARETSGPRADIRQGTLRRDNWWRAPLLTFLGLTAFVVYSTWAAFANKDYFSDPYLSPFYSPCIAASCPDQVAWASINWWSWLSPAIYILIFPLGFRGTCYYYRKAYYRSFWLSPPACAVAEPHGSYRGESRFPLIIQNVHRYFWYFAMIFAGILTWDAVIAFDFPEGIGFGVGTAVLVVNALLIWGYTLGCHSCRHITAGRLNHFSKHPIRYRAWTLVSKLNAHHMEWAWVSLVWIALTDLYIRLVASGTIHDYHWVF